MEHDTHPPRPITRDEYQRLAAFRYAIRKFLRFSEQSARSLGLTPQQHQALLAIKGQSADERATITQLAEWLQLEHHTVVEIVDRMVAAGLVDKMTNPSDRREVLISLTPAGEEILGRLSTVLQDELRRLAPALREMLAQIDKAY